MVARLARLVLALLLCVPAAVRAEDARPWAEGVSKEDQARAEELYKQGTELLKDLLYAQALDKYERAIEHWDHPAIRFNMAKVYMGLEQWIAAYENIELALRYGDRALEPSEYAGALQYKKLLNGRVVRLAVSCDEPGARVTLDGKYLLTGPGVQSELVLAGEHQVVVSKPGRRTVTRTFVAQPDAANRVELGRLPREQRQVLVRRWQPWKPWAVAGAGLAVTLVGVPLQMRAQANFDKYDASISSLCEAECTESELPDSVRAMARRARTQNRLAIASFAVGSAVLVTGLTLVILNRPRAVPAPRVAPLIGTDRIGVAAGFAF